MVSVTRQPVFDGTMNVVGYELILAAGIDTCLLTAATQAPVDDTIATLSTEIGGGHRMFIPCTCETLSSGLLMRMPPLQLVAQLGNDVPATPEVLEVCGRLREAGGMVALSNVACPARVEAFLPAVDFIAVDFSRTSTSQRADLVRRYSATNVLLTAANLESHAEFRKARKAGFRCFKGRFFLQPELSGKREIPALQVNYVRLLSAVQAQDFDFQGVEEIIKGEPSLCYRMLRYVNSPLFLLSTTVSSVRHALALLGEREIRKWISVAALVSIGVDKPEGLVAWALARARFCELLGLCQPDIRTNLFFLGLISSLPALMNLPLEFIVSRLPVEPEMSEALLGGRNRMRHLYELMQAYEAGQWQTSDNLAATLHVSNAQVARCYLDSVKWANHVCQFRST